MRSAHGSASGRRRSSPAWKRDAYCSICAPLSPYRKRQSWRPCIWIIHVLARQKTTDALKGVWTLDCRGIQNIFWEHPPMTDCIEPQLHFSFYLKQKLLVRFDGGEMTSDAGLLLLRQFDQPKCAPKAG